MDSNFSRTLLVDGGIRAERSGLTVGIRLPWYRSLPLSVVEVAQLTIDGRKIAPEAIGIEINGATHPSTGLADLTGDVWYVLDDAVLHVDGLPSAAGEHTVELTLNLYPPYIPGLTWVTKGTRTFQCQ
jgi:hypothetical protein